MVEVGTKFSLLNKKTRALQIMFAVLIVFGVLMMVDILPDFSAELADATGIGKIVVLLTPVMIPTLIVIMLFFPHRYVVTESGINIDSVVKQNSIALSTAESVLLEFAPNQKQPLERIVITAKGKKHYMVSMAANFDKLRDHIVESVDPAIVEDKRTMREIG